MRELTERERSVYEYIKNAINDLGYAPSVRDIRDAILLLHINCRLQQLLDLQEQLPTTAVIARSEATWQSPVQ